MSFASAAGGEGHRRRQQHQPSSSCQREGDGGSGSRPAAAAAPSKATTTTFGWTCPRCTFHHRIAPSARCAMCANLRMDDPVLLSQFNIGETASRSSAMSGGEAHRRRHATSKDDGDHDDGDRVNPSVPSSSTAAAAPGPLFDRDRAAPAVVATERNATTTMLKGWPHSLSLPTTTTSVVRRNNPYAKPRTTLTANPRPGSSSSSSSSGSTTGRTARAVERTGAVGPTSTLLGSLSSVTSTAAATLLQVDDPVVPPTPPQGAAVGSTTSHCPPRNLKDNTLESARNVESSNSFNRKRGRPPETTAFKDAFNHMMAASAAAASSSASALPRSGKSALRVHQEQQKPPAIKKPPPSSSSNSAIMSSSCFSFRPGPVPLDAVAAESWHYPASQQYETRRYQVEMAESCLFHNTLVSLPTGLGKTLVAATVLHNYSRWYPTGIVVFCAPTLPLVHQQVQACGQVWQNHMDPHATAVLTGQMSPAQRQLLWSQKRIVFATPQTVHNDLEQGTLEDPTRIVLLVLDEAHKATGQYSYVRIVELLDRVGAKYRIVGLSATPGANIKAIQKVVDALRITRIDARAEDDPTVAPYTHQRTSEIVLVPQTSSAQNVERAITTLLGPHLDAIKRAVSSSPCDNHLGLSRRLMGNATLTAYQILKAREDLQLHDPDLMQRLYGHFHVVHAFVGLRDNVHKHGIGMVRMKLISMKNDRPRGLMATVIKEEPFQRLCESVSLATSDGSTAAAARKEGATHSDAATTISVQDRLDSNPKLAKLCEVLTEHFERARATASIDGPAVAITATSTTRAIVFSQFRESVSEIVQVLKDREPLIRPRHFIGQGNGAKTMDDDSEALNADAAERKNRGIAVLKGMKQSEQHEVIRDFRRGIYNTLVCTCIGEEGLDIGEVDLIVNFDMLRSPIRMIQRVGRTGRQRQGRVVCLVSEGPEQRTLQASRQSERNLIHALRNPRAFQCHPTVAMFPLPPVRKDVHISLSQSFHASQVEGHSTAKGLASKKERVPKACAIPKPVLWRLSDEEDKLRRQCLGDAADVHMQIDVNDGFPGALRRHFLSALENLVPSTQRVSCTYGRSVQLLNHMKASLSASVRPVSSAPRHGPVSRLRGGDPTIRLLFPIDASVDSRSVSIGEAFAAATATDIYISDRKHAPVLVDRRENEPASDLNSLVHPVYDKFCIDEAEGDFAPHRSCTNMRHEAELLEPKSQSTKPNREEPGVDLESDKMAGPEPPTSAHLDTRRVYRPADEDVFVLPTPPDDGSSDSEEEDTDPQGKEQSALPVLGATTEVPLRAVPFTDDFRLPSQDSVSQHDTPVPPPAEYVATMPAHAHFDDFRLPSDDDDSTSTSSTEDNASIHSKFRLPEFQLPDESASQVPGTSPDHEDDFESCRIKNRKTNRFVMCDDTQETPLQAADTRLLRGHEASLKTTEMLANSAATPMSDACSMEDTPVGVSEGGRASSITSEAAMRNVPRRDDNDESLEDTPSQGVARQPASSLRSAGALIDTPAPAAAKSLCSEIHDETDADDVVCAVCQSGSSTDDDPIVLCDGPADGFPCEVAVHLSCYSIPRQALLEDDWRCDPCAYYYGGGGTGRVSCYICLKDESTGVMKRMDVTVWMHPRCTDGMKANDSLAHAPAQDPVAVWRRRLRKLGDPAEVEPGLAAGKRLPEDDDPSSEPRKKRRRRPLIDVPLNKGLDASAEDEDDPFGPSPGAERPSRRATGTTGAYRHHLKYSRFLDLEAAIDSDDDMEGDGEEEDDLDAIEAEEEEYMKSFINDSSQLGECSQEDDLDRADPDAAGPTRGDTNEDDAAYAMNNNATLHRQLDMEQERRQAFATPALNRRLRRRRRHRSLRESTSTASTTPPASAPGSEQGLGNLHFIRSVLEHHRQGGNVDDVEAVYRQLAREEEGRNSDDDDDDGAASSSPNDGSIPAGDHDDHDGVGAWDEDNEAATAARALRPRRPPPVRTVAAPYVADSSSDDDKSDPDDE